MVCAALAAATAWAANVRLGGLSVIAGAAGIAAVSSGISQMPRP
jgi:predicted phage tail protein